MALEYEILDNGWTTRIHTPIKDLTANDRKEVLDLLVQNTCILWRGQDLTKQDELDFVGSLGYYDYSDIDINDVDIVRQSLLYPDYPGILRVTGKPGVSGYPGQFAHVEELDWHCDRPSDPNRSPFVYLYAVEGSKGSVTHWTNGILAYQDLSTEEKDYYDTIEVQYYGQKFRKDVDNVSKVWRDGKDAKLKALNLRHKIIMKNMYGQKGIAISPLQVGEITGMSDDQSYTFCMDMLKYITQSKYVYSHNWSDGDVVISDQFFGIHKRDRFENIKDRLLHRMMFNPIDLLPELKYEGYGGYI